MKPYLPVVLFAVALSGCLVTSDPPPTDDPVADSGVACSQDADCQGTKVCCSGACVDTSADVNNCGACGNFCTVFHGGAVCSSGTCAVAACSGTFADCDQDVSNGCEANVATNVYNCGACGNECALDNASAACGNGSCVIAQCNTGFADCNGEASDGCELDTRADSANCGACNNACAANETCSAGACVPATLYGFGGEAGEPGTYSDQAWRFSLSANTFEILQTAGAEKPEGRAGHVGAWDSATNRMFVFGGVTTTYTMDPNVWTLDFSTEPATWTRLPSTLEPAPGGRISPCAAQDARGRGLYVFGGMDQNGDDATDLWRLDLSTGAWTLIDAGGENAPPPPSTPASCTYQPETGRFVMFNGAVHDPTSSRNEMWAYSLEGVDRGWHKLDLPGGPTGRVGAKFFDGSSPTALFGGVSFDLEAQSFSFPTDMQLLSYKLEWTEGPVDGPEPGGRWGHATASMNGRLYLFGGSSWAQGTPATPRNDLWEFNPETHQWTELFSGMEAGAPVAFGSALMVAPR